MLEVLFKIYYVIELFQLLYKATFLVLTFCFSSIQGLSSFVSFNDKNYSFVTLCSTSKEQSLSKSDRLFEDILNLSDRQYGRLFIFLISYFQFLHSQGVIPVSSQQKITPKEKMSLDGEYMFFMRAQRGIYNGVPTLYLVFIYPSEKIANPKSAIFQFLRLFKIFAGFRSRWRIPLLNKYLTPYSISVIIYTATVSGSFPRLDRQLSKSPAEQYSVTMKQWVDVLQISKHFMTFGWSKVLRIQISLSSIFKLDSLYFFSSITFIAHQDSSFEDRPLQTLLLYPDPISRVRSQQQDPIFLQDSQSRTELEDWSLLVEPAHFNLPLLLAGLA